MIIRVVCAFCGAKLKVGDELEGQAGKCPSCTQSIEIPRPAPKPAPAADSQSDLPPIPFDSLSDESEPPPIVVSRNRDELGTIGPDPVTSSEGTSHATDADAGSDIIAAGDSGIHEVGESGIHATGRNGILSSGGSGVPSTGDSGVHASGKGPSYLGSLNHYLICDHKDVVARWENDGKGWMIRLKDGFTRASTVSTEIPSFGNFVLVEVDVARRADGLHLNRIIAFQLEPTYALHKLTKGDDVILTTILNSAELNPRQTTHVKNLVKSKFLPQIWPEMDVLLQ